MKFVKGDIIDIAKRGKFDVIIHGCNCFNTMGACIAKTIKNLAKRI
jgi:O-acetyl-ADP-ribose deacetylase (regulator of RNase III)